MPVCTVTLVQLTTSQQDFLARLSSRLREPPLVVSRVVRWVIRPSSIDVSRLLDHQWDLLLVLPGSAGLPPPLRAPAVVRQLFSLQAGIPSSLVAGFAEKNAGLLRPAKDSVPALTGALDAPKMSSSSQNLEMSPDLLAWIPSWEANGAASGQGAISMLNFLAFKPGMHEEYLKYGKAFAQSIGSRRGGTAKLVGRIVPEEGWKKVWDEFALAHYPSIRHFADMAASEDYQAVNHRHRIPSLADTCILMTSELDLDVLGFGNSKL